MLTTRPKLRIAPLLRSQMASIFGMSSRFHNKLSIIVILSSVFYSTNHSLASQSTAPHDSSYLIYDDIIDRGYLAANSSEKPKDISDIDEFCAKLSHAFKSYGWEKSPCGNVKWQTGGTTAQGHPLIYLVYGEGPQTTLLLSGVHPDELTPIPMGFRLANHLATVANPLDLKKHRVVIAPLVNPDGFLRPGNPTRTNSQGVDVNRNFHTHDWYKDALAAWIGHKKRSSRHFPGFFPNSQPETNFQVNLISWYHPDKIMSIHAPLGFLDYDGPGDRISTPKSLGERRAKELATSISEKTNNYRIVDYSFYPGSLGNFAGNEQDIPTITLELQTTEPSKVDLYWKQFLPGMIQSIVYPFERLSLARDENSNWTKKTL